MATKLVSVVTGGSNSHQTSSAEINGIATDFISEGVVGAISATSGVAPTTGAFAVNQIGTPTMDVRVTNGVAYVTATPTGGSEQTFRVTMDATEDVTIAANATGGTRYDWIYIKLDADKLVNPAVDASDVATLTTSRSTSASTDNGTPPTYGYCIAVVTVANGASSITNANITDSRTRTGANAVVSTATVNSTTLYNPYKFSAYASSNVVITNATQKVVLNTERFDTNNNFDSSTNYRYTVPVTGFYCLSAQVGLGSAGSGAAEYGYLMIYKNGAELSRSDMIPGSGSATLLARPQINRLVSLTAGDYLELWCTYTGSRDIVGGSNISWFDGFLVSTT